MEHTSVIFDTHSCNIERKHSEINLERSYYVYLYSNILRNVFVTFKLEIDRYIGLPIFKHFIIIGYRFCKKKKNCHIHNYTE